MSTHSCSEMCDLHPEMHDVIKYGGFVDDWNRDYGEGDARLLIDGMKSDIASVHKKAMLYMELITILQEKYHLHES